MDEAERREGLMQTAKQAIENGISGVENLPQADAEKYLREDWLPFARSVADALHPPRRSEQEGEPLVDPAHPERLRRIARQARADRDLTTAMELEHLADEREQDGLSGAVSEAGPRPDGARQVLFEADGPAESVPDSVQPKRCPKCQRDYRIEHEPDVGSSRRSFDCTDPWHERCPTCGSTDPTKCRSDTDPRPKSRHHHPIRPDWLSTDDSRYCCTDPWHGRTERIVSVAEHEATEAAKPEWHPKRCPTCRSTDPEICCLLDSWAVPGQSPMPHRHGQARSTSDCCPDDFHKDSKGA